jgi:hypothetical protein
MNPVFAKFTLALIAAGLVTMEAQLWAYENGLNPVLMP